jgi:hypothetical protein
MSSLFKAPTINIPPPPTPTAPPPMPDPYSPSAMEAAQMQAATRAGRSSTILTTAANRSAPNPASGAGAPYGSRTLGGGA